MGMSNPTQQFDPTDLITLDPRRATPEQMRQVIHAGNIHHVALIMDGNRRWAKEKHLPKMAGHAQGVEALKKIITHASKIHLDVVTVYAFSTENWRRADEEVGYLLKLFLQALSNELESLHQNRVRLKFIGDLSPFPAELVSMLNQSMDQTAKNDGLLFQVAINYGSRAELVQATRRIADKVIKGQIQLEDIQEETIQQELYTAGIPDPDLLIRTGGESRLSNYLLWQAAYTEFYVTPIHWPDFNESELNRAILDYAGRERRFGQ